MHEDAEGDEAPVKKQPKYEQTEVDAKAVGRAVRKALRECPELLQSGTLLALRTHLEGKMGIDLSDWKKIIKTSAEQFMSALNGTKTAAA